LIVKKEGEVRAFLPGEAPGDSTEREVGKISTGGKENFF